MRRILQQRDFGRGLDRAERLHTVGWGLFLVWGGASVLCGLDWCVGLAGAGAITLGVQGIRRLVGLGADGFWIAVGLIFVIVAGWDYFEVTVQLPMVAWIVVTEVVILLLAIMGARDLAGLKERKH